MKKFVRSGKFFAVLMALMLVMSLCACDKNTTGEIADGQVTDNKDNGTDKGDVSTGVGDDGASGENSENNTSGVKDDENTDDKNTNDKNEETDPDEKSGDSDDSDKSEKDEGPEFMMELPEGSLTEQTLGFDENGKWEFNVENGFSTETVKLNIVAPANTTVYYTLDGSTPDEGDSVYSEPITFAPVDDDMKTIHVFKAVAIYNGDDDYYKSEIASRSFFVSEKADTRYSMLVLSISGEPSDLTESPKGILYGQNYKKRGREYEKPVFLEAFEADGTPVFAQYAGARVYGGYSRQYAIKSLKFYARKSYDEDHKNFKIKVFDTPRQDGSDKDISKYDRLVMRSHGNDFQFLYLRDELSQALVKKAGFADYESCVPAAAYLNGEYYGFFWLHENYCDKYFKEKYGKGDGEFVVLEGGEQKKSDDEDYQAYVDEYNKMYGELSKLDLKDDANYAQVSDFLDVNNYLDYMAWNIAINNSDWPHNNYKCYRYAPAGGEAAGEGVFDGKWRFLPHDMDYAYGLYDQRETIAGYDTLKTVLKAGNERYAPMLAALLERSDCRTYFKNKMKEFFDGVLAEDTLIKTYEELDALRKQEMPYYYDHLEDVKKSDWSVWTAADQYDGFAKSLYTFAAQRKDMALKYLEEDLPDLE